MPSQTKTLDLKNEIYNLNNRATSIFSPDIENRTFSFVVRTEDDVSFDRMYRNRLDRSAFEQLEIARSA